LAETSEEGNRNQIQERNLKAAEEEETTESSGGERRYLGN
jgi:hypothetical protein